MMDHTLTKDTAEGKKFYTLPNNLSIFLRKKMRRGHGRAKQFTFFSFFSQSLEDLLRPD